MSWTNSLVPSLPSKRINWGRNGSNELGSAHIFPWQGEVGERAASPVEEPLARRVESVGGILHPVARILVVAEFLALGGERGGVGGQCPRP